MPLEVKGKLLTKRNLIVWLTLTEGDAVISTNLVTFSRPKHLELEEPGYELNIEEADGGFAITLEAARPALWVWLELEGAQARYSENFFHLQPGMPVCVTVTPAEPMSRGEFVKRLAIRSLVDTYAV